MGRPQQLAASPTLPVRPRRHAPAMPQQLVSTVSTSSSGTSLSARSTAVMAPKDFW